MRAIAMVVVASVTAAAAQTPRRRQEIDTIAAFARLYGMVRYFHQRSATQNR